MGFDLDKSEEQLDKLTSSEIPYIELKNNLFKTSSPPSNFFIKEVKDEVMDIGLITYAKAFQFLSSFLTHR